MGFSEISSKTLEVSRPENNNEFDIDKRAEFVPNNDISGESNGDVDKPSFFDLISIDTFEIRDYISEVDETRANETAEIMADIFSEDVLTNWSEMPLDEKAGMINEYYIKAGENLGIGTKGVIIEPMSIFDLGYNTGDGYIHINELIVDDPTQMGQVLNTATHEMRHQFQNDVLASPENFSDIPQDVLETWEYEMENYIDPDYDPEGYWNQTIECDARGFAGEVLICYADKMDLT